MSINKKYEIWDMDMRIIELFNPSKSFPAISITGGECDLKCAHCNGQYLKQMLFASTPEKFIELCEKLDKQNKKGVLISGGCDHNGAVKLSGFANALKMVKERTGLVLNVHTGLINETTIKDLVTAEVDVVSFDVVGSKSTIELVYGLNHDPSEYKDCLKTLKSSGIKKIVPHICIGLEYGKINGEFQAVDIVSSITPKSMVFLIIIPTKATKMANIDPPTVDQCIRIVEYAKEKLPNTKLYLGCMRPRSAKFRNFNLELEDTLIRSGIRGIVLPAKPTVRNLKFMGFKTHRFETCCAVP